MRWADGRNFLRRLRAQKSGEGIAVTPEQKELEDRDDESRCKTFGRHECVEDQYIEDDRGEDGKPQRNKAADEQEQAAGELHRADDVNIATGEEHFQKIAGQVLRRRRHRDEVQKCVGAEHDEYKSEKNASDNSDDFHTTMLEGSNGNANPEVSLSSAQINWLH